MALAVSLAENGTRQCDRDNAGTNKDGSTDIGVFQINAHAHRNKATADQLRDCRVNIHVAKQIYDASGWNPWVVYQTGTYKRFIN
jgi:hypothetical protein